MLDSSSVKEVHVNNNLVLLFIAVLISAVVVMVIPKVGTWAMLPVTYHTAPHPLPTHCTVRTGGRLDCHK